MPRLEPIPIQSIPDNIVETLQQEQRAAGSFETFLYGMNQRFFRLPIRRLVHNASQIVEPADRTLGYDVAMPSAAAFHKGGLLGIRVVAACLRDTDLAAINTNFLVEKADEDPEHELHEMADAIMDMGASGYASVDTTFEPLFEKWERHIVPDVNKQRYLRNGFGLPIILLDELHARNKEIEAENARIDFNRVLEHPDEVVWEHLLD